MAREGLSWRGGVALDMCACEAISDTSGPSTSDGGRCVLKDGRGNNGDAYLGAGHLDNDGCDDISCDLSIGSALGTADHSEGGLDV
jgi:hypothetical protein